MNLVLRMKEIDDRLGEIRGMVEKEEDMKKLEDMEKETDKLQEDDREKDEPRQDDGNPRRLRKKHRRTKGNARKTRQGPHGV